MPGIKYSLMNKTNIVLPIKEHAADTKILIMIRATRTKIKKITKRVYLDWLVREYVQIEEQSWKNEKNQSEQEYKICVLGRGQEMEAVHSRKRKRVKALRHYHSFSGL